MAHERARSWRWVVALVGVGATAVILGGSAVDASVARGVSALAQEDTVELPSWEIPRLEPRRARPGPPTSEAPDSGPPLALFTLEEIAGPTPAPERVRPQVETLGASEVEALLAPLPPLERDAGPDSGDAGGWIAGGPGPSPEPAPLAVVGVFPRGEVEAARDLTVLFSRPATRLGAGTEALSSFTLEPAVPGRWSWLDATTARFTPEAGRMPGGRDYRLRAPLGAFDRGGGGLAEALEAAVRIRGPLALGGGPAEEIVGPDAVFLLGFDQMVDPETVARATRFRYDPEGGAPPDGDTLSVGARAVTIGAVREDLRRGAEGQPFVSTVALAPTAALPRGARLRLELDAGLTSTEGPRPTGRAQHLAFETSSDFTLDDASCGDRTTPCIASGFVALDFSNPVDPEQPLLERVRVTPAIDDLEVRPGRDGLVLLRGGFQPWTSYEVRVDGALVDAFGVPLGSDELREVHFGRAPALLSIPGGPLVTLDPEVSEALEVAVRGTDRVRVELYRADPDRWTEWTSTRGEARPALADRLRGLASLGTREVVPEDGGVGFSFLDVPLGDALADADGAVVVRMVAVREAVRGPGDVEVPADSVLDAAWVQSSPLRVLTFADRERLHVWASDGDGEPAEGGRLRLPAVWESRIGPDGTATLPLDAFVEEPAPVLEVEWDGRTILVPPGPSGARWVRGPWRGREGAPQPVWATTLDRPLHRPGETLALTGWLRAAVGDEVRDLVAPDVATLRYRVHAAVGSGRVEVQEEGLVDVGPDGGFHLVVELPADLRPSRVGRVELEALDASGAPRPGWSHRVVFRSGDFRRPEYQVVAATDGELRVQGEPFEVEVEARYFDGPPLPASETDWTVEARGSSFRVPGWSEWSVGRARISPLRGAVLGDRATSRLSVRTDAVGRSRVAVGADTFRDPFPLTLVASATVQDLGRQAGSATVRSIVHPAAVYPAVRFERRWGAVGRELTFDVARVDPEGVGRPTDVDDVEVAVERLEAGYRRWWEAVPVVGRVAASCETAEVGAGGGSTTGLRCRATPDASGVWVVSVTTVDDRGRPSRSEADLLVLEGRAGGVGVRTGADFSWFAGTSPGAVDELGLTLTGRRGDGGWSTGDTVAVEIEAPFPGGRGVAVLDHMGIRRFLPVAFEGDASRLELRLPLAGVPGERAVEVLVQSPDGRRLAGGRATLEVGENERRLAVAVEGPDERVRPGAEVPVRVTVTDPEGRPVEGAGVTVWVVDEALLFAGGGGFDTDEIDPWEALHRAGPATSHRGGLFLNRWTPPAPPDPGELVGRILDGGTGDVPQGLRVEIRDGSGRPRFAVPDEYGRIRTTLAPGPVEVLVREGRDTILARSWEDGAAEGIDLGTILVPARAPAGASSDILLRAGTSDAEYAMVVPAQMRMDSIGRRQETVTLREDFSPLAGFRPGLVTDAQGRVEATVGLPGTVTRYRIFATAVEGRSRAGAGEAQVVAGLDLVVRAQPPRFLRAGDRADLTLLVQNGSDRDREIEVALRATGLALEGTGGVRVPVAAGDRAEVRIPARATALGTAELQVRATSEELDDAVAVSVPVEIPAAPEIMTHRMRLDPGSRHSVGLAPLADAHPGWGGLEIRLAASALGSFDEELTALAGTSLPWAGLRIARVRGLAALERGLSRDRISPADTAALRRLRAAVDEDLTALGDALRSVRADPTGTGLERSAESLGAWSHHQVYEAIEALADAEGAGLVEGAVAGGRSEWLGEHARGRITALAGRAPGPLDLHLAWVLDRTGSFGGPLRAAVDSALRRVDPEGLRPLWLARIAALLGTTEGDGGGRFLEALENRAVVTAGGVTFRRGPLLPADEEEAMDGFVFSASHPGEDAEVLFALVEVAPDHPLVPGLAATVAADGSDPGAAIFGPGTVARSMAALEAWAARHEPEAVDARVEVTVDGASPPPVSVRTGAPSDDLSLPMERLPRDGGARVDLGSEGVGTVWARVRLDWTPEDPVQPAEVRGIAVRRRYEPVDDPADVSRDDDGTWRIRAGARVRVVHELLLPARRTDVRLRDAIPAGLEPLQGTTGDEGAGRAPALRSVQPVVGTVLHPVIQGWRWYRASSVERDAFTAWSPALPAGSYQSSYVARATSPGEFVVPGVRAWEAGRPDVMGRGETHRVVVEEVR